MDRVSFFRLLVAGVLALLLIAGAGWTAAHAQHFAREPAPLPMPPTKLPSP
jgi:hypothetical protein